MHAALHNWVIRPLQRLSAEFGADAADELPALESALEASRHCMERLAELESQNSALRHDVRGILSPALLTADRLAAHADPKVAKAADAMIRAVERAAERLQSPRNGQAG